MSVGNTPRSRKPSLNENFGLAVCSLPIHFGGSAFVFRVRKVYSGGDQKHENHDVECARRSTPSSDAPALTEVRDRDDQGDGEDAPAT